MSRLHIDWNACDGRGLCAELLPELLTEDEWGYPIVRDAVTRDAVTRDVGAFDAGAGRTGDPAVPAGLERAARMAVDRCPALALKLVR